MVPKLRFRKFSKEWTKIRLGDYLQNYQKKVSSDTDIPVYSSSRQGLKPQAEYFANRELQNDGEYGVVPFGYITYRHMSDDNTFHFNLNNKLPEIAVSKEYPVFTGKGLNNYFLLSKLNHTDEFKLFAVQQKAGGTRTRLYFKNLCEWRATFPELEEQIQISDFLSSVDERIKLLSKQYGLLCQYKKGMMQKIFSQELRFKDDSGRAFPEWKSTILDEVVDLITNGLALDQNDSKNGYPVSRIETISEHCINMSKVGFVNTGNDISNYKLNYGDMLFSNINSISHIGKIAYFNIDDTLYHGMNLLRIVIKNSHCKLFFYYQLTTDTNKKYFESRANQAVSQASINQTELRKTPVQVPCQEEQTKIANFLSALDDKITVKKAELDKLKTWKQGLLQQMFI